MQRIVEYTRYFSFCQTFMMKLLLRKQLVAFSVPTIMVMLKKYYNNNISQSKSQKHFSTVLAWELKFENYLRWFSKTNKTIGISLKPHKVSFIWKAIINALYTRHLTSSNTLYTITLLAYTYIVAISHFIMYVNSNSNSIQCAYGNQI